LDLLSDAREKTEELIDKLYHPLLHEKKPRAYRRVACGAGFAIHVDKTQISRMIIN
jgi:hypothetical protein